MSEASQQLLDGKTVTAGGTASVHFDGLAFLNFAGCNYLALNKRLELKQAAIAAVENFDLLTMYLPRSYGVLEPAFSEVERLAAQLYGREAAIYLPSGYHIGAAGFCALDDDYDEIFIDEMAHWSLSDAAVLSSKPVTVFKHKDLADLSNKLSTLSPTRRPIIATDGVFATSGELAPLHDYYALAEQYGGLIIIDDSHGIGCFGEHGGGVCDFLKLGEHAYMGATLSKGVCGHGAIFAGSLEQIAKARNVSAVRGATAGSVVSAEVSSAAIRFILANSAPRENLAANVAFLRAALTNIGVNVASSPAPIISFSLGSFDKNRQLQQYFFDQHIYVLHSNYIAAGPAGVIRLSIFADHQPEHLNRLLQLIKEFLAQKK